MLVVRDVVDLSEPSSPRRGDYWLRTTNAAWYNEPEPIGSQTVSSNCWRRSMRSSPELRWLSLMEWTQKSGKPRYVSAEAGGPIATNVCPPSGLKADPSLAAKRRPRFQYSLRSPLLLRCSQDDCPRRVRRFEPLVGAGNKGSVTLLTLDVIGGVRHAYSTSSAGTAFASTCWLCTAFPLEQGNAVRPPQLCCNRSIGKISPSMTSGASSFQKIGAMPRVSCF
jgi:hypothetical protein